MFGMFRKSIKTTGYTIAAITILLSLLVGGATLWSTRVADKLAEAQTAQYTSYLLADELRQSSDDLTRLARTYAITGNPEYERQYLDILDIRNGNKERPENYNRIYWDLIAAGLPAAPGSGDIISLDDLMKKAGFTETEFAFLDEARANSDGLVALEVRAMNAVKGRFKDSKGNYTVKAAPDLELARNLLHSVEYHKFKGDIMVPVNSFIAEVENRFASQITTYKSEMVLAALILEVSVGLLLIAGVAQILILALRILQPVARISDAMTALNKGETVGDIPGMDKLDEIGAMARTTAAFRERSEEAVKLSEEVRIASEKNEENARKQAEAAAEVAEAMEREKDRMAEAVRESERATVFQKQIAEVVSSYARGDFTKRLDTSDKEGVFATLSDGINQIGQSTESSLGDIREVLKALADGDLSQRAPSTHQGIFNDIGQTLNETSDVISGIVEQIALSGQTIDDSTQEISSAATEISRQAEQTAASLEETAAAVEELTASVRSTSDGATDARQKADSTASEAKSCAQMAQETVAAMEGIEKSSKEIGQIIKVIEDIAFQTNLLALNAGVEAARAGEAGRGFAVVASEVRGLAQRSSEAAKEINDLIGASDQQVKSGVEKVGTSSVALENILQSVEAVAKEIVSIAEASNEQSAAISEISTSINKLDRASQSNVARFEETTAASIALRQEASVLATEVSKFKTESSGGGNSTKAQAA